MKKTFYLFGLVLLFFSIQTKAQQLDHILGELLIQLPSGTHPDRIISELQYFEGQTTDLKIGRKLKTDFNIWLLRFNQNQINEIHFLNHLRNQPSIDFAQFNHILTERQTVPDDPQFSQQWQWLNDGSTGGIDDSDVDADSAWDITTGGLTAQGDTIVVCVMEGANREHEDLQGNLWFNANEIPDDNIDNDNNGYIDDIGGWNNGQGNGEIPFSGHGTAVSGMIGAVGNNNLGVTGINWNVKIMHVSVGGLNDANVMEAYTYPLVMRRLYNQTDGAEGAFIVATNASWGIDGGQPSEAPLWCNMYDALGEEGVLNCGATANIDWDIDVVGDLPTACPSDFMVSVTATNDEDLRTFSAYGLTHVDLGAPGGGIFTLNGGGGYSSTSGTSFASPLTAGIIALLYSAPCSNIGSQALENPQATALLIRDYLYSGVDETPQLLNETVTGGRANAFNSLELLLGNCEACATPFALNATNVIDTSATLSWFESDSVLVSDLRYRIVGDTSWINIEDASTPYDLNGLFGCSDYEFQVAATCTDTSTEYSESYLFSTEGCCFAPENISINAVSNDEIVISWDPAFAALGYVINSKTQYDSEWTETIVNSSSITFSDLSVCTNYEFELATICTIDSTSEFSDTLYFTTECPCAIPENIDTSDVFDYNATIFWDASDNADYYNLRYRIFGGIDWTTVQTSDISFTLDSLDFCTFYQYQVQTICPIANSEFSDVKIFKSACTVGLSDLENVNGLSIYPNPIVDQLLIDFNLTEHENILIKIFNTTGQIVRSVNFKDNIIGHNTLRINNLNDIPAGLYFIEMQVGTQSITKKVIKK